MAEIELRDVSLKFRIRQKTTFKEYMIHRLIHRLLRRPAPVPDAPGRRPPVPPVVEVHALRDVSLSLRDGHRVGIIGHNGAGKSTLLKLMAGIYPPTAGTRTVKGQICSLFDISLGFEGDANGWDNIAYRAYLQGETPRTLREKIHAIAEFSELGHFLNVPVRYYSAGMMVRLAFSIATAVNPEILLIDEVLGVGDLAFQLKARRRMEQMMESARLMVLISHDLASLRQFCTTGVWMDHGAVVRSGPVDDVIRDYLASVNGAPAVPPNNAAA